jgi:midasin
MEIDGSSPVQDQGEPELPLPTAQLQPEPQPLSFNLSAATLLFLQTLGALPSTRPEQDVTLQMKSAYSTTQWVPLLPLADLQLLLSTLPTSLLPADLPFAVQSARQSAGTRQAVLDTLARLALEPSLTMEIMRRYTPLSVHLWGRWLEMLGFSAEGEWRSDGQEVEGERVAVEKVYRAMVACVAVYDNIFPYVGVRFRPL